MGSAAEHDESFAKLEDSSKQTDDALRQNEELATKLDQTLRERDDLKKEVESLRRFAQETEHKFNVLEIKIINQKPLWNQHLIYISKAQEYLEKIVNMFDDTKSDSQPESASDQSESLPENVENVDEDLQASLSAARLVSELAVTAEEILRNYRENNNKEKRELEISIVSLREENKDISTLLRSALAEKEAAEKAFSKSRGGAEQKHAASPQRKGAILQIAERGLQKVVFGFRAGAESLGFNGGASDNEGEDEAFGLAFAMEGIIKSLRLEITELRWSLEALRAEANHLRELSGTQAEDLANSRLRIKELEERESSLTENVEGLTMDIIAAEEEIARWREACELEAAAGKAVMEECQEEIATLKRELEETKQSLDRTNNKLKSKEDLATAAIIARDAAERSLHLADSRTAALRERIEELNRQFEELEGRGEQNSLARMRYVCWPWRWLKIAPIGNYRQTRGYTADEMEELLDPPT